MNKKIIFTALLALVALASQAKEKKVVWEQPTTEFGTNYGDGFFNLALDVTKVELKEAETVVHITAKQLSDIASFQFASGTYLKVGEKRYAVVSADGIELNKYVQTDKDGKREMVFHFPPLPKDTKSFDFIEGDGDRAFQIKGIKPVEERWKQLFPSYWRNAQGDWKIAFFEDCAIYDCKFWDYKQCNVNPKTGEATIVLANDNDVLKVKVGKNKKGTRTIQIGNEEAVYSMITSRFLPDYPAKDLSAFKDNGYRNDTVTFVGWLKDMPEDAWKKSGEFEVQTSSIYFLDKKINAYGKLDSLGRFTVKMPVENTQKVFMDWGRLYVLSVLEPGETYFFLHDFKTGQQLMMGSNARVQNELLRYRSMEDMEYEQPDCGGMTVEQAIAFKNKWKGMYERNTARLDSLLAAHPTLSRRFEDIQRMSLVCDMAEQVMMSSINMKGQNALPAEVTEYVDSTLWKSLRKPYTIERINFLLYYHIYNAKNASPEMRQQMLTPEAMRKMEEKGLVEFTDEEHEFIDMWEQLAKDYRGASQSDRQELDKKYEGMRDKIMNFVKIDKVEKAVPIHFNPFAAESALIDSLYADPDLRDICKARMFCQWLDETRYPLTERDMDFIDGIKTPSMREKVLSVHEKYLALKNNDFAHAASLRPSTDVENMTDGEKILRKIIEPYKGRLIYVDIWGTWCGPCKEALSHSQELYEQLKDYDIVYLYLANRSSEESWKNVIKEYNLTGENCVHYNLPADQQSAIEHYLSVNSFPTYKLIDKDGSIHDLDWLHHENLGAFKKIIEKFNQ